MNDFHTNFDSPLAASAPDEQTNLSSAGKEPLSPRCSVCFCRAWAKLFNRQPGKALVIGIITHIFGALAAHPRLLLSFWTMVASVLVVLAWQLLVAAEAARTTATGKKPEAPIPLPWLSYPLFGRDCRAQLKEHADQHRVRMRAEIPYDCFGRRIQSR